MRRMFTAAAIMIAIFVLVSPSVMARSNSECTGGGNFFKYIYQWLRDNDGDGIPNGLDPDYIKPEDGTGYGKLGPGLAGTQNGDMNQNGETVRDRDRAKDGTCDETCTPKVYKFNYDWDGSKK